MKIRKGKKQDFRDYLKHQLEAFPNERRERHKRYFAQKIERDGIFIAELDGKYIGHLTFSQFISPPFVNSLYLEEFVIAKSSRGKGYGKKMLDRIITKAKQLRLERVILNTWNNPKNKAIRLYRKYGFKKVGTIKNKYGNNLFLELELK
ncbi:GNAT family N-acetyltransferase [Candidatus Woesearchaeota archaeon]|nr:GNAT family N-acetyltransferase [Candidatus Woesearchaeota archaeon]